MARVSLSGRDGRSPLPRRTSARVLMAAAVALALAFGLTGCYDSVEAGPHEAKGVTLASPGQYKGKVDPLIAKLEPGSELPKKLNERFELVQAAQ